MYYSGGRGKDAQNNIEVGIISIEEGYVPCLDSDRDV